LKAATVNPVIHYNLPVGLLRKGDFADMVVVKDLDNFEILETYINGEKVYGSEGPTFRGVKKELKMNFRSSHIIEKQLSVGAEGEYIRVIAARDGELFTECRVEKASVVEGCVVSDIERDLCKIVVVNKYADNEPSIGFVSGFGLKRGAIAGSVSHDSHNIIAVGVNDAQIAVAVNTVLDMGGGLTAVDSDKRIELQLEIAGLMTNAGGNLVADRYRIVDKFAKCLGSELTSPFMTLSFMSLLVIPELKLGDMGLFDVNRFSFTSLFV
jgi:adenine deaminase